MYCPQCGSIDKQDTPFCRSCGADLARLRSAVFTSGGDPKTEIAQMMAAKIRSMDNARDLERMAEDVLPQIEKFLETPEEKRMRRMRAGTMVSCIGVGTALAFLAIAAFSGDEDVLFLSALGAICFFVGLGLIVNGLFLTVAKTSLLKSATDEPRETPLFGDTAASVLSSGAQDIPFASVTENTTRHLDKHEASKDP